MIINANIYYNLDVALRILLIMLFDIIENIRKALGNKSFACGIFVDIVNHNILLKKF